jgi:hypothetical protein
MRPVTNGKLGVPREAEDLKNLLLSMWVEIGRVRLGNAATEPDSPELWSAGDKIAEQIWQEWSGPLTTRGFTRRKFIHLMRHRTDDLLLWSYNRITWDQLIDRIINLIDGPIGQEAVQGTL